ncbi:permease [Anaerocolumna xylanovorans]|uniref:CobW/HypB/UreG nucleotide-binding domain-containing protein n=1 Tax=Anaerocolumna xylanovorans DSM 12503 TaxID=1121345 RepID=A0A1M7YJB6_9FIRM|nr:permease [Anaerocolumna xylanovorans]SHO52701.1 hypothetical protein SAMN02745217_03787 [Anaerocolumna xylanovorans DSM 12503]
MAVDIDVVTGFLESGKTTFIKQMIASGITAEYEGSALLLCEEGEEEYEEDFLKRHNITLIPVEEPDSITGDYLKRLTESGGIDYIMIEYNGTWDMQSFLNRKLVGECRIRNIVFVSEAAAFNSYYSNMAGLLRPHMGNSDYVVVNRYQDMGKAEKTELRNKVKRVNPVTKTVFLNDPAEDKRFLRIFTPFEDLKKTVTPGMILLMSVLLVLCFLPTAYLSVLYDYTRKISVSFLSILIQAVPFILLGAFLSSILQLIIPVSFITRQLSGNSWKSFLAAGLAGFFFPVCDCGLAPLISGLLKKNLPLPQIITFWLASAAVNPVVILSVYYAFPDNRKVILARILSGIVIAVLVGCILMLLKVRTKEVIRQDAGLTFMSVDMVYGDSRTRKAAAVIKGAQLEFFRVFKYVIIGAFVSSLCLTFLPQTIKLFISTNTLLQFFIMLAAAVFMSTCSTSNAFIGRSFYGQFTLPAVLSFMVLGPMLDFKNIIILSEVLTKKFIIQLCLLTSVAGFLTYTVVMFIL